MLRRYLMIVSLALAAMIFPTVSRAGQTWQSAKALRLQSTQTIVYGQLTSEGQADFYRLDIVRVSTLRMELGQPSAFPKFVPRVVLYQPDSQTIGPSLPMDQPPKTLALVYPAQKSNQTFEVLTQVTYNQTLDTSVKLTTAGTYFLAVYNAGPYPGRYRLTVDNGHPNLMGWADMWRWPQRWWRDQAFAGWSWQTLLTPALLIVLVILVIEQLRFYHLHHLAPSIKKPIQKKKKSSP